MEVTIRRKPVRFRLVVPDLIRDRWVFFRLELAMAPARLRRA
jgi:hypothetical protein